MKPKKRKKRSSIIMEIIENGRSGLFSRSKKWSKNGDKKDKKKMRRKWRKERGDTL